MSTAAGDHIEPADAVDGPAVVAVDEEPLHVDKRWFIPGFLIGWALIVWGAMRALEDSRDAHPFALVVHIVTFDLFHDLVIAPVVVLFGWLLGKVVPKVARGPVRAAVAFSVIVVVFAYPLLRRWGQRPTNSSTLPLPYARNIVIVVAATWVVAAAVIIWRMVRDRPTPAIAPADDASPAPAPTPI